MRPVSCGEKLWREAAHKRSIGLRLDIEAAANRARHCVSKILRV